MFRYRTILPALLAMGALGLLVSPEVRAQTADNLKCRKCVGKGEIDKNAVTKKQIKKKAVTGAKIKDGSVDLKDLSPEVRRVIQDLQDQIDFVIDAMIPQTVFLTSELFTGNLGGLAGADTLCAAAAANAGLPGNFKAWLSDGTDSPNTRFGRSAKPYVRLDGVTVADDYQGLLGGGLQAAINIDENGLPVAADQGAWTNTHFFGDSKPPDPNTSCNGWTDGTAGFDGAFGRVDEFTSEQWTEVLTPLNTLGCDRNLHLYCMKQSSGAP